MEAPSKITGDLSKPGLVSREWVKVLHEPINVPVPNQTKNPCEPTIELIHQGDVVQAIDVTCTCGKKIRIQCMY